MTPAPTPADFLAEALRLFASRTKPDSIYADPLFRRRLPHWHARLGRDVNVELMPDLVLRVRDPKTGEVLAQSKPGQIDQLDTNAPHHLEIVFSPWMKNRFIYSDEKPVSDQCNLDKMAFQDKRHE
jgi:hypothetical protein